MGSMNQTSGSMGYLLSPGRAVKEVYIRHQFATNMHNIKASGSGIIEKRDQFMLQWKEEASSSNATATAVYSRSLSSLVEGAYVIGIECKVKRVEGLLLEGEPQLMLISIVGMGGLGKLTLAHTIYSRRSVKEHFRCRAWVIVSQSFTPERILSSILVEFQGAHVLERVMDVRALRRELHGRFIITARNEGALPSPKHIKTEVYTLEFLSEKDAWSLFCKNVFGKEACPPELVDAACLIVKKCGGLPLAIVDIGRMMSKKKPYEWATVRYSLEWELSNRSQFYLVGGEVVRGVLLLSYEDLPAFLKHCFLHCCLYPKDYLIFRGRQGMLDEEVAEEYFKDLLDRNLILVGGGGGIVRALGIDLSHKKKFGVFYYDQNEEPNPRSRRVSMNRNSTLIHRHREMSCLRTFFTFGMDREAETETESGTDSVMPGFLCSSRFMRCLKTLLEVGTLLLAMPGFLCSSRFLRVLDLHGMRLKRMPEVGHLVLVRYFTIEGSSWDDVVEVPESIANLTCLQTLHLNSMKGSLPSGISNLVSLKCLKLSYWNSSGLRLLKIELMSDKDGEALCSSIQKMKFLHSLSITTSEGTLPMRELLSPSQMITLHKLRLWGRLEGLPSWFNSSLSSLTVVELGNSFLRRDPFRTFQKLPELTHLDINTRAYSGEQIGEWCIGWREVKKGAMPCLREDCKNLSALPEGFQNLCSLQTLRVRCMSDEFMDGLRHEDRYKVQHIPVVQYD
ncbi:hypothetical protein AMTRI_Chr03g47130 [Amborella trichopoda]